MRFRRRFQGARSPCWITTGQVLAREVFEDSVELRPDTLSHGADIGMGGERERSRNFERFGEFEHDWRGRQFGCKAGREGESPTVPCRRPYSQTLAGSVQVRAAAASASRAHPSGAAAPMLRWHI